MNVVVVGTPAPGRATRVTIRRPVRTGQTTAHTARGAPHPAEAEIPEPTAGEVDALRASLNEIANLPGGHEMARVTLTSGVSFVGIPDLVAEGSLVVTLRRTNRTVGHTVRLPAVAGVSRAFYGQRNPDQAEAT